MEELNILIVDDDSVDRHAIKRYLTRPGRRIVFQEAETGAEAARLLQESLFDCVFLDYSLPDTDGISLLRKFYDVDLGMISSPTVMLTGQGSESVMIDAIRWGAQDYLIKDHISTDVLHIVMTKAREVFDLKKSQHQAAELLRQSQKMEAVGQLTSGIAHDFNNLLTVVLGNARLIQKRLQTAENMDEESREDLTKKIQAIDTAAKKGANLIRRLMVFTRQRPLAQDTVDINQHIQEVRELLRRTLGETIDIKTMLRQEIWPIQIDTSQLENALINIALNARDAMGKGGSLTIETENIVIDEEYTFRHPDTSTGSYVMITISDTGHGMTQETLKRIFEPFYTTKEAGEGTGLGLSMVYGFVRQSNGHVHVYSEIGHGTVFRIYLPKYVEEGSEESLQQEQANLPEGDETILVVEDDEEVRNIAVSILERLGYKILTANDGRMALEVLKREYKNIDLIFTDIVMPRGMSGIELIKNAREYYPQIKVLYTSGYSENAIPDYQLITGESLLGKPYRKEKLAKKIREVLDTEEESINVAQA